MALLSASPRVYSPQAQFSQKWHLENSTAIQAPDKAPLPFHKQDEDMFRLYRQIPRDGRTPEEKPMLALRVPPKPTLQRTL